MVEYRGWSAEAITISTPPPGYMRCSAPSAFNVAFIEASPPLAAHICPQRPLYGRWGHLFYRLTRIPGSVKLTGGYRDRT